MCAKILFLFLGKWHNRMNNITVTGPESSGVVMGLKPAKIYLFRVLAENRIGKSEPSKPVEAITQEEGNHIFWYKLLTYGKLHVN